jgi:hypothetical protein
MVSLYAHVRMYSECTNTSLNSIHGRSSIIYFKLNSSYFTQKSGSRSTNTEQVQILLQLVASRCSLHYKSPCSMGTSAESGRHVKPTTFLSTNRWKFSLTSLADLIQGDAKVTWHSMFKNRKAVSN